MFITPFSRTKTLLERFRANTVVCNAKRNHACTYFVCSELLHPPREDIEPLEDRRFRVMYKQQECYVQYTYNSICNVFVVLNCSAHSMVKRRQDLMYVKDVVKTAKAVAFGTIK